MALLCFRLVAIFGTRHNDFVGSIKKILLITGFAVLVLWLGLTSVSYSGTCVNCLAHAEGNEIGVLGLSFFSSRKIASNNDQQLNDAPQLSPINPKTFETITGQTCEHVVKRSGMGWRSFGSIACGSSPERAAFAARIKAMESLFRLFERTADQSLARESLALIDALLPANTDLKQAMRMNPGDPKSNSTKLTTFTSLLSIVTNTGEWLKVNAYAKQDFKGESPLLRGQ